MLYEVDWAEDGTYRPGEENSPEKFFNDCLENSKEFDLQLGYFSSAAISVLADGFASFISKGGKMRLVINHIVSEEDKQAITKGVNGGIIECFDLSNFEELRKTFDEYQQQFFECLAFLIYDNRIDIRIIRPRNTTGIAHTKSGQFRDGDSVTSFTGSANFTISGLFNNLEEIKIDRSDSIDPMIRKRIENQRIEFDKIMAKKQKNIEYLSPDKLISAVKSNFGDKTIEELLDVEQKLRSLKKAKAQSQHKPISDYPSESIVEEITPHFPYPSGPREYQVEAFENWKNNGQKGLFAMATGTGKTITSLNCLYEIYKRNGYYKALILVPTIALVEQWEEECMKFGFTNIYKVCSKVKDWRNTVGNIKIQEIVKRVSSAPISYIIISTYASFCRKNIFPELIGFPQKQLLFIADEAHNMGSGLLLQYLGRIPYLRRIGLSATPERQFDTNANEQIMNFFGCNNGEYTYSYTMEQAIQRGALCHYYYYPHIVHLTEQEMMDYIEVSKRIAKLINYKDQDGEEMLKRLLLKRKRIIHKAVNKKDVFKNIITERLNKKGDLKYSLVYVPEGMKPEHDMSNINGDYDDLFDMSDEVTLDNEYNHLIDEYTSIIRDAGDRIVVRQFTSDSTDRDEILKDYAQGAIDVLTSMKCLDEGVDVPRSEFAVFCSSTGNPRQFIQRRGRVLRLHPDKQYAIIHDLIVIPDYISEETFQLEKTLISGELRRIKEFARLSENFYDSVKVLDPYLTKYTLSIFN